MRYSIERSSGLNSQENMPRGNSVLCGFAFDNTDNHKRITTGENFYILGGSPETHENLVEKILEFNQVIKKMVRNWMTFPKKNFITSQMRFARIKKRCTGFITFDL